MSTPGGLGAGDGANQAYACDPYAGPESHGCGRLSEV